MAIEYKKENFIAKAPLLTEGLDMYQEFAAEGLNFLRSAENSLLTLETVPNDSEAIDNTFKVFHTIAGLAGFLNLDNIQFISHRLQIFFDMVRKKSVPLDENNLVVILEATYGLQKLLILLSEQVESQGYLKSPYLDLGEIVENLVGIIEIKASTETKSASEGPSVDVEKILENYRALQEKINIAQGSVHVEAAVLKNLVSDLQLVCLELKAAQHRFSKRQRDLIRERDDVLALNQRIREISKKKSDFFVNIAHEIRTLINAILGFCDLIRKTSADSRQKEHLQTVSSSGKLLLEIVNDIMDLSKVESGRLTLESVDFHLHNLINDVVQIMQIKVAKKPIKLFATIESGIPETLNGDPTRIKQILINLIDNAIKFTEKGEITLFVGQEKPNGDTAKNGEHMLRFVVHDSGLGISPDKKDIIFESFRQAELSTTRKYGGSGLGLAICKGYVEAMGGRIWVESQPGKGSRFIFTIKFDRIRPKTAGERLQQQKNDGENDDTKIVTELAGSCQGIKVLVVDDSVPNQELIKAYFGHIGCTGEFASNGQEAIDRIKQCDFDLCFMDVLMPVMDGLEAVEIIRKELAKQLPVIALTAATEQEQKDKGFRAGMSDYLQKPFDIIQLANKILEHYKKRQQ